MPSKKRKSKKNTSAKTSIHNVGVYLTPANVAKGLVATLGGCALFLYWDAGAKCAISATCGKPVSDIIGVPAATVLFRAGGIDYAGYNIPLSFMGVPELIAYVQEQETLWEKILKGGAVCFYATSQVAFIVTVAHLSGSGPIPMVLAGCGALPGSIFPSVMLARRDVPYWMSEIKYAYDCVNAFISPAETFEQAQENDRKAFYRDQTIQFREGIKAELHQLVKFSSLQKGNYEFVNQDALPPPQTWSAWAFHKVGNLVGTSLVACLVSPAIKGVYNLAQEYVSDNFLINALLTLLFTSGNVYVNLLVEGGAAAALFDAIHERAIVYAPLQRSPLMTALFSVFNFSFSAFSFAVINGAFEGTISDPKVDGDPTGGMLAFKYLAWLGIVFYHTASMFHLYSMLMKYMSPDEKLKRLLVLEDDIKAISYFTPEQYRKLAESKLSEAVIQEKVPKEFRDKFKIESYDQFLQRHNLESDQADQGKWSPYRDAKYLMQFTEAKTFEAGVAEFKKGLKLGNV